MRLWFGVALTIVAVALVVAFWLAHEVSAQQGVQGSVTIGAQPAPGFQPPVPGAPVGPPGQPPAKPPAFGGPMPPLAPSSNVAITANSEFVYLVWGNMLLQFDARTLKLIRRVPLKGEFPIEKPEKLFQPEKRKQKEEKRKEEQTKKDQPKE
ncbi:MAG: hypothetical protein ACK4I8_10035 [Armatimonadota bacterium]